MAKTRNGVRNRGPETGSETGVRVDFSKNRKTGVRVDFLASHIGKVKLCSRFLPLSKLSYMTAGKLLTSESKSAPI